MLRENFHELTVPPGATWVSLGCSVMVSSPWLMAMLTKEAKTSDFSIPLF